MSKNLLIRAYLNEIPRNMSWPSATLGDWKHWFPNISCSQQVNKNIQCKSSLSSLNFSAELSVQTRSQPKFCLLPHQKWQAAEEEHFICWLGASSFRGKGNSVGNGRRIHFISLCTFKHRSWHCCNYHHFLHWPRAATKPAALSMVLHHFIFTVLLWGLADLEWKSSLQSYSPACSLLNQIIKGFLNSEWLVIDWLYSFSPILVMWKAGAKSWGPFQCPEWGIRSTGRDVAP